MGVWASVHALSRKKLHRPHLIEEDERPTNCLFASGMAWRTAKPPPKSRTRGMTTSSSVSHDLLSPSIGSAEGIQLVTPNSGCDTVSRSAEAHDYNVDLVPGGVSPDLSPAWAIPAAYGDLIAVVLPLLALAMLKSRLGLAWVWVFNLWGAPIA